MGELTAAWQARRGWLGSSIRCIADRNLPHLSHLPDLPRLLLQEAERNLCVHLNTLAMRLVAKAEEAPGGSSQPQARAVAAEGGGEGRAMWEDEEAAASPPPAKRPRKSKGGGEVPRREELQSRALQLLEQSFRVADKGIAGGWVTWLLAAAAAAVAECSTSPFAGCSASPAPPSPCFLLCRHWLLLRVAALNVGMDALEGMPDIEATSGNTVAAWKKLQINTASQLRRLHAAAGREELAKKMDVDVQARQADSQSASSQPGQAAREGSQGRQGSQGSRLVYGSTTAG